jgi:hypothetical protein
MPHPTSRSTAAETSPVKAPASWVAQSWAPIIIFGLAVLVVVGVGEEVVRVMTEGREMKSGMRKVSIWEVREGEEERRERRAVV